MSRHRFIHLTETGSTNKDALRLALSGEPLPLWVSAQRQTDGKGRAGRSWVSIPGNLHLSVALQTRTPPERIGQLALVAGIMLHDAVAATTNLAKNGRVRIKWPNDLLCGRAKLGGILVESTLHADRDHAVVVIGFGLNVLASPDRVDRAVTSLAQEGNAVGAERVISALTQEYDKWMAVFDDGRGFSEIRGEWMERAGPLGEPISVNTGSGLFSGTYCGISDAGALVAEVEGRHINFSFGDVDAGNSAAS